MNGEDDNLPFDKSLDRAVREALQVDAENERVSAA